MNEEEKHATWLKSFEKTKAGKIHSLLWDVKEYKANLKRFNRTSYIAAALYTLVKNTKYENDVTELIKECDPEFFTDK